MSKKNSRPSIVVTADAFDSKKVVEVVDFKTGDDLNTALNFLLRLCASSIVGASSFMVDDNPEFFDADPRTVALFIADKFGKDLVEVLERGFSSSEDKVTKPTSKRKKGGDA
jgi:hypothetical protein